MQYVAPASYRPSKSSSRLSMQLKACCAVALLVWMVFALKPIYGRRYTIPVDSGYVPWRTTPAQEHTIAYAHPQANEQHQQQQQQQQQRPAVRDPHRNMLLEQVEQQHKQLLVQAKVRSHQEAQQLQARLMVRGLGSSTRPQSTSSQQTGAAQQLVKRTVSSQQQQQQQVPVTLDSQRRQWPEGYLAVCVVVRDQVADLRYWLEYHKWLGVDKFYIFDHNSTQPAMPALFDHITAGTVEYQYFVGHPRAKPWFSASNQFTAYQRCLMQHWRRHRWIAFLDADEFLVLHPGDMGAASDPHRTRENHLGLFMAQYEKDKLGALGVNWVLFGSSGLEKRPEAGPLAAYTKCIPKAHEESRHVKLIVNTRYVLNMGGTPHEVQLRPGAHVVDEHQVPFTGPKSPGASWDKIALHHYVLKSKEEFASKTARGSGAGNTKTREYWLYVENIATDTCAWAQALSRRFLAAQPQLTFCTDAFVQGYGVCPGGAAAAAGGIEEGDNEIRPGDSRDTAAPREGGRLPQAHEAEEQRQRQRQLIAGAEAGEDPSQFELSSARDMAAAADAAFNAGARPRASSSGSSGEGSSSGGGGSLSALQQQRHGYLRDLLAGTSRAMQHHAGHTD